MSARTVFAASGRSWGNWLGRGKFTERKRHLLVDTLGLLLGPLVAAADIQDRDGGIDLLVGSDDAFPRIALLWVDEAYAGEFEDWAALEPSRARALDCVNGYGHEHSLAVRFGLRGGNRAARRLCQLRGRPTLIGSRQVGRLT